VTELQTNVLYYGDNLDILRRYVPDESVDLIYLDPPFNSNRDYNVIFRDESGNRSDAQLLAFEDTWHWGPSAESTYRYLTNTAHHEGRVPDKVSTIIAALRSGIGSNQMMAYLVEMAVRLVELHRVLKPTGSLYLHCDPTASHYLKLVLDCIFGPDRFLNEIVWKRTHAHGASRRFGAVHDILLSYAKTDRWIWNNVMVEYTEDYKESFFKFADTDGRRYRATILTGSGTRTGESGKPWRGIDPTDIGRHWAIPGYIRSALPNPKAGVHEALNAMDEMGRILWPAKGGGTPSFKQYLDDYAGAAPQDVWTDIRVVGSGATERLGYPTQKPVALLERIIGAASNPGDLVLDPFCGCGTALIAAHKIERRWLGIDITYLSIAVMKARLKDSFGIETPVIGQPTEVEGARQLAQGDDGRYQFQWWALNLIDARPLGGTEKKGADRGIDGRVTFTIGPKGEMGQALVSVKSGKVNSSMVRDLKGTIEREKAEIGVFITLEEPSSEMKLEATTAGVYTSPIDGRDYPRIQILTIAELLEEGKKPMLPLLILSPYQQAERIASKKAAEQQELFG
jgi:site-specific DNA-methyltransferase (adenine-specific)